VHGGISPLLAAYCQFTFQVFWTRRARVLGCVALSAKYEVHTYTHCPASFSSFTWNSDRAANLAHLDRPTPPDSSPDDLTRTRDNTMPSPQKRAQRARRYLRSDAIAESSSPSRPSKRRRKVWIDPCPPWLRSRTLHKPCSLPSLLRPGSSLKSMHPRFMPLTMLPRAE
jgi:hypothetical protein